MDHTSITIGAKTNKPAIGDQVAICRYASFGPSTYDFGYTISRITPSGQMVVKRADGYERKFDKHGEEMSGSSYNRPYLRHNVAELELEVAALNRSKTAVQAILAVKVSESRATWGKGSLAKQITELQVLLDAARAAVEAI